MIPQCMELAPIFISIATGLPFRSKEMLLLFTKSYGF